MNNIKPTNPNGQLDTTFKNEYMNAWIDPLGNIYELGLMGHSAFAAEYLQDVYEEVKESGYNIVEYLMRELKWMRVMQWRVGGSRVVQGIYEKQIEFTKKQKEALFDLCMKYNSEAYKEFFDGEDK